MKMKSLAKSFACLLLGSIVLVAIMSVSNLFSRKTTVSAAETRDSAPTRTEGLVLSPGMENTINTVEGWAWYKNAADGYAADTLVLNGCNMELMNNNPNGAISFSGRLFYNLVLADGSVNKIKMKYDSNYDYVISVLFGASCDPSDVEGIDATDWNDIGNLSISGSGSLEIEYDEINFTGEYKDKICIFEVFDGELILSHAGNISVKIEDMRTEIFLMTAATIEYNSGEISMLIKNYSKSDAVIIDATIFSPYDGDVKIYGGIIKGTCYTEADERGKIFFSTIDRVTYPLSERYPTAIYAGDSQESLSQVDNITDLANKNAFKFVGHAHLYTLSEGSTLPTNSVSGAAPFTCDCGRIPLTVRLPVLTDSNYAKVHHAATTEADAYDVYTYRYNGEDIEFTVNLVGTKLPAAPSATPGGMPPIGGDTSENIMLSPGVIAGIAGGSVLVLLLVMYFCGYFLLYRTGKLDNKKIKAIYSFLPKKEIANSDDTNGA